MVGLEDSSRGKGQRAVRSLLNAERDSQGQRELRLPRKAKHITLLRHGPALRHLSLNYGPEALSAESMRQQKLRTICGVGGLINMGN